jgi:hypothetical protein
MIAHKKQFVGGFIMMVMFVVVLIIMFMPIFGGQNFLNYMDNLYNSISKGSANFIPAVREEAKAHMGNTVEVTLQLANEKQAEQTADLFNQAGALVNVSGPQLKASGDLGKILANALADAELLYNNDGEAIYAKYGLDGRRALFNWWTALKGMDKDLKKQKKFKEAKIVTTVKKRTVETAFNFYQIEPQNIGDRIGMVLFSLVFYVIYTLWYGFAIMFMFEGWGMKLEH